MWKYNNNNICSLEDIYNIEPECIGFVYKITNTELNKIYIGKKKLFSNKTRKLGKKEIKLQEGKIGRPKTKEKITSESDWKNYNSSNKLLQKEIKENPDIFNKEILFLCKKLKELTYFEVRTQMDYRVIEIDSYNDNILGSFYSSDFE